MKFTALILIVISIGINLIVYGATRLDCKLPEDTRRKSAIITVTVGSVIALMGLIGGFMMKNTVAGEVTTAAGYPPQY